MRKFLEKFYSLSPLKRFILLFSILLTLSLIVTSYSFYNLWNLYQYGIPMPEIKICERGFSSFLKRNSNYEYINKKSRDAIASFDKLFELANKHMRDSSSDYKIIELSGSHEAEVVSAIRSFNNFDWKYMALFANYRIDPFRDDFVESYRTIRSVARFLTAFYIYSTEKYPDEENAYIVESVFKLSRLNDLTSPFLIGKMISIAIEMSVLDAINEKVDQELINTYEARRYHGLINKSIALDSLMKTTMNNELVVARLGYFEFSKRVPLAMWLLEKIYGNPIKQYSEIVNNYQVDNNHELSTKRYHPFITVFFPNYTSALERYEQNRDKKNKLLKRLSEMF